MRSCALALVLVAGCASAPVLLPSAPASGVQVDGRAADWAGALRPAPGEAGLRIGLRDDGRSLYVVLVAGDDWQARRLASGGLTLWLDPTAGDDRAFGVGFPLPVGPGDGPGRPGRARPPRSEAGERARALFANGLDQFQAHVGDSTRVLPEGALDGVETAARWTEDGLVVEVRLPLGGLALDGLPPTAAASGPTVSLGIEMTKVNRLSRTARTSGDPRPPPRLSPDGRAEVHTETRWIRVALHG